MAIRLAILGLDPIQRDWLEAAGRLRASGEVEIVGVGHRSAALAKDVADPLEVPALDDLRQLLKATAPQVILLDRPENATLEFLTVCLEQGIGLVSLGPVVENYAEARVLAEVLEPRTQLLYIWPRFAETFAWKHCAQADEYLRPIKFASLTWLGMNHALAKSSGRPEGAVRSLSVLAWDAISTLISLIDVPTSVYASLRGTAAGGATDRFADITGSASLTLRFADDVTASVTLSDRVAGRRELLVLGQAGSLRLDGERYSFCNAEGQAIDEGVSARELGVDQAVGTLRGFLEQFTSQPSPHRGWEHRLEEIASVMEALLVSHRTGSAENPEKFRGLRR
jgi:predicted dehydrogenase